MHADHVTGAWLLRAAPGQPHRAGPRRRRRGRRPPARSTAIASRSATRWLAVRATPGHTDGCLTYVLDDESRGLHRRLPADPRLRPHRFPAGRRARAVSARCASRSSRCRPACLIYPGARLPRPDRHQRRGGAALQPAPGRRSQRGRFRRLHAATWACRTRSSSTSRCRPTCAAAARRAMPRRAAEPTWAPLACTFAGIWEIAAARAGRGPAGGVQIVDVREPDEFHGALGHIARRDADPARRA